MSETVVNLPPRTIRRYMNNQIAAAVIWCVFGAATTGPILAGLLLALELTKAQIGFVMSLALLFQPMQIIGALLQKRFFNRKTFWTIFVAIHYGCFLLIAILAAVWLKLPASFALTAFMLLYAVSQWALQTQAAVQNAWVGDVIPARESTAFWSRRSAMALLATMVCGILMGKLVDLLGRDERSTYAVATALGALFGFVSMYANLLARDPYPKASPGGSPARQIREVLSSAPFRRITAFFSFQAVAAWVSSGFIFVYLQRDMSFSMTSIQVLNAIACVVGFFAAYLFRAVGTKYGNRPVLILCSLLKTGEFILYANLHPGNGALDEFGLYLTHAIAQFSGLPAIEFQSGFFSAIPIFMLGGFVNIGLTSSQMSIITSTGSRQLRSISIGVFSSIVGLAGFLVSSQSGLLYEFFDTVPLIQNSAFSSFNVLSMITAAGYFLSLFIIAGLREDGAAPTADVVRTLFSANPIRSVYQVHLLAQPLSEGHREETLRRVKSSFAANELIDGLYNPSSRVRDGALLNICRLDGEVAPEIVDAVVKLLDIPELGMQAMAARTLGRLRARRAIPDLIRHFEDDDLALAQASLSAASWIGAQEAEESIVRILRHPRRVHLWSIAAEALSRIGDQRYVRLVLPLLDSERYWVIRMQTLISLCRLLLPDKVKIHPIFEAEERRPGSEIERLLKNFCAHPIWPPGQRPSFEVLMRRCDENDFLGCCEAVLPPQLALFGIEMPAGVEPGAFLSERFLPGRMREELLNSDSYIGVSLYLELQLWSRLRYQPDDSDRFLLLTSLIAAERLIRYRYGRRDDPVR